MSVFLAAIAKFRTTDCVKIIVDRLGKGCTSSASPPVDSDRDSRQDA
jgi:hypothetical protein